MKHKEKVINRLVLPALYILVWVLLYLLPRGVFYIGSYTSIFPWILAALVLFGLPYFLHFILKRNGLYGDPYDTIAMCSVFLVIPLLLITHNEDKKELEHNPRETKGIVVKAYHHKFRRVIDVKYTVNGEEMLLVGEHDHNTICSIGDTVTVIYTLKTPEFCEIKELKEYYQSDD